MAIRIPQTDVLSNDVSYTTLAGVNTPSGRNGLVMVGNELVRINWVWK